MTLADCGVNTSVVPPGGWYYIQDIGDGQVLKIGPDKSDSELLLSVQRIRAQMGIPNESCADDIAQQIKARSPRNDSGRIGRAVQKTPQITRISEWQSGLAVGRVVTVPAHKVCERASICAKCPQNIFWKTSACAPCNERVMQESIKMRRQANFNFDPILQSCRKTGEHLPLAVFLDRTEHPVESKEGLPENCWLNDTEK